MQNYRHNNYLGSQGTYFCGRQRYRETGYASFDELTAGYRGCIPPRTHLVLRCSLARSMSDSADPHSGRSRRTADSPYADCTSRRAWMV